MLNPLFDPRNFFPLLSSYIFDANRIYRYNRGRMKRYQDKMFKKIVRYAFKIPMYHDKYRQAGISPSDIKKIEDITKLPFITKEDLRKNYPDKLLPKRYNQNKAHVICTGGSTGKSVSIYTDFYTIGKSSTMVIREMKPFDLDWKKARYVHIGNFNECRIDLVAKQQFHKYLKPFFSFGNRLDIDVNTNLDELLNKLDSFKPDVILSYPAIFQHLASIKNEGKGKNIHPTVLFCGGTMLDESTRKYVQNAFGCPLLNTYQSVEAQSIIASECTEGTWHINNDFFYLEVMDKEGNIIDEGKRGHIVLTRLWGRGTPIIRYTGMDDWGTIKRFEKCKCGLSTSVLVNGVEGRKKADIILPDGKVFPAGAFCFIEPILSKYQTFVVKQYQIIQKKTDQIDILLVIDKNLINKKVNLNQIKKEIKDSYRKKVGPEVKLNVKEVEKLEYQTEGDKPTPIVVSHVKKE